MKRPLLLAFCLASAALAADATFRGPMLGQIYDRDSKSIRPIIGTPGAALVAQPANQARFENAAIAGDGSVALVYKSGDERISWLNPAEPDREPAQIADSLPAFDLAAFSPNSTAAVVYLQSCNCAQVLGSLPSEPKKTRAVSLPEGISVNALAITNDSSIVAVADSSGKVYLYRPDSTVELNLAASAFAFRDDGLALAVIDSSRKTVALVSNLADTPEIVEVASERDGLRSPSAVGFRGLSDLIVADKDAGIHLVNLLGGGAQTVECACQPTAVEKTATASVYRITPILSGAVWVVHFQEDRMIPMFIPVAGAQE